MSGDVCFIPGKSQEQVTQEWDLIAPTRDGQLRSGDDISFSTVLQPWVLSVIRPSESVADVGCGTGVLTKQLSIGAETVLGIDPSASSIAIARQNDPTGIYHVATLETFVDTHSDMRFDVVVANMVLMDVLDIRAFCKSLAHLARGGRVAVTLTHPAFWPLYWGYANLPGFDYKQETVVEAPFRTAIRKYPVRTTHVHRPLEEYARVFAACGLRIQSVEELRGAESAQTFPFPRFLAVTATA